MIARIKGEVIAKEDKAVIIDVSGIGFRVAVIKEGREKMAVGQQVSLHIYHNHTDETEELYGFQDEDGVKLFKLLLTVPSVGPKTAMNILDMAPPPMLSQAVSQADVTILTKVSGVGKKTAERIITELKGKVAASSLHGLPGSMQQEIIEALVSIGYSPAQARKAVAHLPAEVNSVEAAVKYVLQKQK